MNSTQLDDGFVIDRKNSHSGRSTRRAQPNPFEDRVGFRRQMIRGGGAVGMEYRGRMELFNPQESYA